MPAFFSSKKLKFLSPLIHREPQLWQRTEQALKQLQQQEASLEPSLDKEISQDLILLLDGFKSNRILLDNQEATKLLELAELHHTFFITTLAQEEADAASTLKHYHDVATELHHQHGHHTQQVAAKALYVTALIMTFTMGCALFFGAAAVAAPLGVIGLASLGMAMLLNRTQNDFDALKADVDEVVMRSAMA